MTTQYRAVVGLNWPPDVRREPGADVTDVPAMSIPWLLADGCIVAYDPDAEAAAAKAQAEAAAAALEPAPTPADPDLSPSGPPTTPLGDPPALEG